MTRRKAPVGLYAELGPRPGLAAYPAVFNPTGVKAHLLSPLASPNTDAYALCGLEPRALGVWMGTGDEDEYDIARYLPLCVICEAVAHRMEVAHG